MSLVSNENLAKYFGLAVGP